MMLVKISDWQERAACRDLDRDMFFPDDDVDMEARALAVCNRCPVQHACLQYALGTPEKYGVWGGLTEAERRSLLARRRRVHCPGCGGRDVIEDVLLDRVELCRSCGLSWKI